jgi:WD40 repeat protein
VAAGSAGGVGGACGCGGGRPSSAAMLTKALSTKGGVFGKPRSSSIGGGGAAGGQGPSAGGGGGAAGGGADLGGGGGGGGGQYPHGGGGVVSGGGGAAFGDWMWPVGKRMPTGWRSSSAPGEAVACLRAHPEGVRALVLTQDHKLLFSCGGKSSVKAWRPAAVASESVHAPVARHALPEGHSAVAMTVCAEPYDSLLALATTDRHVRLLTPTRLGGAGAVAATAASFRTREEDGDLLLLSALGGASHGNAAHAFPAASGGGSGGGGSGGSGVPASVHSPLLLYTTEGGAAVAIDPRKGGEAWRLPHSRSLGLMQAGTCDAAGNWLLLGSSSGRCVLWDLRYALQLQSWQCPGAPRIRAMIHVRPPGTARPTVLMAANDNLVCGWDLGDSAPHCTLVLQPHTTSDAATVAAAAGTAAGDAAGYAAPPAAPSAAPTVRCLLAPLDGSSVLTGSSDARLRCWRLAPGDAPRSYTVGGSYAAPPPHALGAPGVAGADTSQPLAYGEQLLAVPSGTCRVLREYLPHSSSTAAAAAAAAAHAAHAPMPTGGAPGGAGHYAAVGAEDRGCAAAVTSAVYCAPQGSTGLLFAGALDGTVRVWK